MQQKRNSQASAERKKGGQCGIIRQGQRNREARESVQETRRAAVGRKTKMSADSRMGALACCIACEVAIRKQRKREITHEESGEHTMAHTSNMHVAFAANFALWALLSFSIPRCHTLKLLIPNPHGIHRRPKANSHPIATNEEASHPSLRGRRPSFSASLCGSVPLTGKDVDPRNQKRGG